VSRAGNAGFVTVSSTPPDPSSSPADQTPAPPPGSPAGEEGEGEEIKNPRIKELSEEAGRHRLNAKAEKERADRAEAELAALKAPGEGGGEAAGKGSAETIRSLRLQLAFLKANLTRTEPFKDVEAAMRMVDFGGVQVDESGTVTGLDEAIAYVAKKYPYMVNDSPATRLASAPADVASGRPNNGARKGPEVLNRAVLEKKFPALRRGR
jgi:hypothetical protein